MYDVTVYTRGGFDLAVLNELAGTKVRADNLRVKYSPGATLPLGALAHAFYMRSLPRAGRGYDLRVTASGVMNWKLPAIHFISSVTFNEELSARFVVDDTPKRLSTARKLVRTVTGTIARNTCQGGVSDIFVMNSEWTREHVAPFCPGKMVIVYPPVPAISSGLPWHEREDAVLVFGRIASEKRIEACIEIVEQARAEGADLTLYIAGPSGEASYMKRLEDLFRKREDWVRILPLQTGDDKRRLLGRLRYGLSACEVEAFGISTAEMTDGGMIVLVPRNSGQSEIVVDSRLQFRTKEEAVEQLRLIYDNPTTQLDLHHSALSRNGRFSTERYMTAVKKLTSEMHARSSTTTN
jgi:glycosyltransferase involved in cell wall biosynthesis